MKFYSAFLFTLAALSGCATTDVGRVQSPSAVIVPPGKAKVVITRNSDSMFMGVQARIDLNGERVAELWRGESYAAVVQPGKVILGTDAWSTPGNFRAHFNAKAGREYTFVVSPRGGHMATLTFFGIAGAAVDASIDKNTGPFSIYLNDTRPLR